MTKPLFETACIIGIGLIGSSIAHALRGNNLCTSVIGYDDSETVRADAVALGVVDGAPASLGEAVAQAGLVILCVPVGAIGAVLGETNATAKPGAVLMDVGSVKGSVAKEAGVLREDLYFVPAHPVAGTEQSGPAAGFATLFKDRWLIITPLDRQDAPYQEAIAKTTQLWEGMGAMVTSMTPEHHDIALAVTSHLPHLIAFTLVGAADDIESVSEREVVKYSAGGFRDFTRIAASNPVMWRDVFLTNKDAVLEVLGRFSEELAMMQRAIRWGDAAALEKAFTRSRGLRQAIIDAGQETAAPNFGRDEES